MTLLIVILVLVGLLLMVVGLFLLWIDLTRTKKRDLVAHHRAMQRQNERHSMKTYRPFAGHQSSPSSKAAEGFQMNLSKPKQNLTPLSSSPNTKTTPKEPQQTNSGDHPSQQKFSAMPKLPEEEMTAKPSNELSPSEDEGVTIKPLAETSLSNQVRSNLISFTPRSSPSPQGVTPDTLRPDPPPARLVKRLLQLVHRNEATAQRLLNSARVKNPGQPERWYYEKVIFDLERDRH